MPIWRISLLLFLAVFSLGCLKTPNIDEEKAGLIAGVRFLETYPGQVASYTVKDTGGDAYVVYFNVTSPEGKQIGFAEYYVDKFTKDVYASPKYAAAKAIEENSDVKTIYLRYPGAKTDPHLIIAEEPEGRRYVWEIKVIANAVDVAVIRYDATNDRLLSVGLITSGTYRFSA